MTNDHDPAASTLWPRRDFLYRLAAFSAAAALPGLAWAAAPKKRRPGKRVAPVIISTWPFGVLANDAGWKVLAAGGSPLDAAVAGVQVVELDPKVRSVGLGGRPNAEGVVQLDACVMDGKTAGIGGVSALEGVATAAAVARKVMEKTRHVLLTGAGAKAFALSQGFAARDLLTAESKAQWQLWRSKRPDGPLLDNHDTIGMLVLGRRGHLAGACTTSGLAWKMPGRVGDSPLIGHGLFVDDDVGAAAATGVGEEVIRIAGSHTVVEMMRAGRSPQQACEAACRRIITTNLKRRGRKDVPADAFIAVDRRGRTGACAVHQGWHRYALTRNGKTKLLAAKGLLPRPKG